MNKKSPLLWIAIILGVALVGVVVWFILYSSHLSRSVDQARLDAEQQQLTIDSLMLANEFESVNAEFLQYENAAQRLTNDTIYAKYTAAKQRVEQLMQELKSERTTSRARIAELQGEIATLKSLLRHYIAQIDSLSKENAGLRAENQEIKTQNRQLTSRVRETAQRNEELSERMTLAEKLNVTGVDLTPLQKNGKREKNVTKARQLMVTFTIPQNNSTPVGTKTIYARITNPEGQLLGDAGTFPFEGTQLAATARRAIEYTGEEITGVTIYWDVNTTLTPGDYTVELFTDGYRLASRRFTLKK